MGKSKKSGEVRVVTTLQCLSCVKNKDRKYVSRYSTYKNKRNKPDRLEIKKYCRYERKHLIHKEIK